MSYSERLDKIVLDTPEGRRGSMIAHAPETAAERDRLKVVNDDLLEAFEYAEANARLIAHAPETAAERDRLKALHAELVSALKGCEQVLTEHGFTECPLTMHTTPSPKRRPNEQAHAAAVEIFRQRIS